MSEPQLFEWDVKPKRKKKPKLAELVPRPPGYHLIANRSGVVGFHRSRIPEAGMAQYHTVVTLCGITGRRIGEYPDRIPLCEGCEKEYAKGG